MLPYGLPREWEVEYCDVGDLHKYARKSYGAKLPGKGGDVRSYIKKSAVKRQTRRYWKRKARKALRDEALALYLEYLNDKNIVQGEGKFIDFTFGYDIRTTNIVGSSITSIEWNR